MRIGMFTDGFYPQVSGVSTSILTLANELRKMGHTVYVITTEHKKAKEDPNVIRLKGFNVPLKAFSEFQLIRKAYKKYASKIDELNLDIIHIHTEFSIGRLGLKYALAHKIPYVYTIHTMYEDYMHFVIPFIFRGILRKPFVKYVKKYLTLFSTNASSVILPNEKVISVLDRHHIECNYSIIPTGLYLDKFDKSLYSDIDILNLKNKYGIKDEKIFMFVGRVSNEKSIDLIMEGFIKSNVSNAKLLIVGDGPQKKKLEKLKHKIDKENKIIFTGMIPNKDIGLYYHMADVFLNASKTETQGLTYIEALASELALIVKYDKNLDSIIIDKMNGLFYNNDSELIDLINNISNNDELLNNLKKNAKESVLKFDAKLFGENVSNLYYKILDQD